MLKHITMVMLAALFVVSLGLAVASAAETQEGTIKSVSEQDKQVVVAIDGEDQTLAVPDTARLTLDGKACKLADLKAGQLATLTVEKNGAQMVATAIAAKTAAKR